jgi:hypothetical protein
MLIISRRFPIMCVEVNLLYKLQFPLGCSDWQRINTSLLEHLLSMNLSYRCLKYIMSDRVIVVLRQMSIFQLFHDEFRYVLRPTGLIGSL